MLILNAEIIASLRLRANLSHANGQITMGQKLHEGSADPGDGNLFEGWETTILVTHNTATATVNMLEGSAAAAVGSPNISDCDGKDAEGKDIPTLAALRAILIEDTSGTGTRQLLVDCDGDTITIPQGGHMFIVAPVGASLDAVWHSLTFSTSAAGQSWVRITCLGVRGD